MSDPTGLFIFGWSPISISGAGGVLVGAGIYASLTHNLQIGGQWDYAITGTVSRLPEKEHPSSTGITAAAAIFAGASVGMSFAFYPWLEDVCGLEGLGAIVTLAGSTLGVELLLSKDYKQMGITVGIYMSTGLLMFSVIPVATKIFYSTNCKCNGP